MRESIMAVMEEQAFEKHLEALAKAKKVSLKKIARMEVELESRSILDEILTVSDMENIRGIFA